MAIIDEAVAKIEDWKGRSVSIQPLPGGLTNTNYKVEVDGMPYFVRVPGESTELLALNRANEVHNSKAAAMSNPMNELKQAVLVNTLRSARLFAGLPPGDLHAVADIAIVKSLDKGDYLFREGDPSVGFYIVQRGSVNIHRVNAVGKEQVIQIFRAGESFAEATLATACGVSRGCAGAGVLADTVDTESGFCGAAAAAA